MILKKRQKTEQIVITIDGTAFHFDRLDAFEIMEWKVGKAMNPGLHLKVMGPLIIKKLSKIEPEITFDDGTKVTGDTLVEFADQDVIEQLILSYLNAHNAVSADSKKKNCSDGSSSESLPDSAAT